MLRYALIRSREHYNMIQPYSFRIIFVYAKIDIVIVGADRCFYRSSPNPTLAHICSPTLVPPNILYCSNILEQSMLYIDISPRPNLLRSRTCRWRRTNKE